MAEKTSWHVALFGGLKREGRWRMDAHTVVVTPIGGADLDLSEADLATNDVVVTKVSLVGGFKMRVPSGVNVDVTNVSLFGRQRVEVPYDESAPARVHIRAFSIVGGVKVQPSA
jgi:predicted membrane protein